MTKSILARALVLAAFPLLTWAADVNLAIVVNKTNPVDNLTLEELRKVILGQQDKWANGKKVSVLMRSSGAERDVVLKSVCSMTPLEFQQYFVHANFNGDTAAPPKSLASAAVVRQLVATLPGSIGFLRTTDVNDSVKVIKLEGAKSGDEGYKLKAE